MKGKVGLRGQNNVFQTCGIWELCAQECRNIYSEWYTWTWAKERYRNTDLEIINKGNYWCQEQRDYFPKRLHKVRREFFLCLFTHKVFSVSHCPTTKVPGHCCHDWWRARSGFWNFLWHPQLFLKHFCPKSYFIMVLLVLDDCTWVSF